MEMAKRYSIDLSNEKRIAVSLQTEHGEVTKFSVCLLYKIHDRWFPVKRADNAHVEKRKWRAKDCHSHAHSYVYRDGRSIEISKLYLQGTPGENLTKNIKYIKKYHDLLVANFLQ